MMTPSTNQWKDERNLKVLSRYRKTTSMKNQKDETNSQIVQN